jgi:UDP-N-acetylmuramoylalanine--D-glutamate ligase
MPTTGYKLSELLDDNKHNIYKIDSLEEAVKVAYEVTEEGKSCLLSPAAASYEAFKNFEEKGKKYKEYIDLYK